MTETNEFWVHVAYRLCRWFVLSAWSESPAFVDHSIDVSDVKMVDGEVMHLQRPLMVPLVPDTIPDAVSYIIRLVQALKTVERSFKHVTADPGPWRDVMLQLIHDMHTNIEAAVGEIDEKKFKEMKEKDKEEIDTQRALKLSKKVIHGMASHYVNYIRHISENIKKGVEDYVVRSDSMLKAILTNYQQDIRFIRHSLEHFEHIYRFDNSQGVELGLHFMKRVSSVLGSNPCERLMQDAYVERLESLSALGKLWQRRVEFDSADFTGKASYQEDRPELLSQLSEQEYLSLIVYIDELILGETNGLIPMPSPTRVIERSPTDKERIWGHSWSPREHKIMVTEEGESFIPSIALFDEAYDTNMLEMGEKFPALKRFYRQLFLLTIVPTG